MANLMMPGVDHDPTKVITVTDGRPTDYWGSIGHVVVAEGESVRRCTVKLFRRALTENNDDGAAFIDRIFDRRPGTWYYYFFGHMKSFVPDHYHYNMPICQDKTEF